jgi:cell division protein ZapA (FtsZ GTPase activity inhibitor)
MNKLDRAIKELESSLIIERSMINPNKVKSLTSINTLECLVEVIKEETNEIKKRDLKIKRLEERIAELEEKFNCLFENREI